VASSDESIAARIAVLERVTQEILVARFMGEKDPVASFRQYAGTRRTPAEPPGAADDPKVKAAWADYLDMVLAGLQAEIAERE
jgi:hypothetical protein